MWQGQRLFKEFGSFHASIRWKRQGSTRFRPQMALLHTLGISHWTVRTDYKEDAATPSHCLICMEFGMKTQLQLVIKGDVSLCLCTSQCSSSESLPCSDLRVVIILVVLWLWFPVLKISCFVFRSKVSSGQTLSYIPKLNQTKRVNLPLVLITVRGFQYPLVARIRYTTRYCNLKNPTFLDVCHWTDICYCAKKSK